MINSMIPFIVLAVAEVLIGFFIYAVYAPVKPSEKHIYRYVLNLDSLFCDIEKNKHIIWKVNKITFIICILASILTLLNGILTTKLGFVDIKEQIFIVTIIVIFAFRYIYIMKKCNGR